MQLIQRKKAQTQQTSKLDCVMMGKEKNNAYLISVYIDQNNIRYLGSYFWRSVLHTSLK